MWHLGVFCQPATDANRVPENRAKIRPIFADLSAKKAFSREVLREALPQRYSNAQSTS
jgi:hypothetical protein